MMGRFIEALKNAFFPKRCAYCGNVIRTDLLSCSSCEDSLPRIEDDICLHCGRGKKKCSCKKAEKYFDGIVSPFYFTGNVRNGIHKFKFNRYVDNAEAFGTEMAKTVTERYNDIEFDFITEVPMTSKKERERGYNQSKLLSKNISKILSIPYCEGVLVKIYETEKQHGLKLNMRKGNLSGVFDVKDSSFVKGKSILLCDDISTTGETLNECAKMLWLYGAKEIYCITAALTVKEK